MQAAPLPSICVHQSPPQYQARDFRQDPICLTEEKYCLPSKIKFDTKNKSLTHSLKFKRVPDGQCVFKCEGKVFSLKDKKVIKDGESGETILTITKELLSLAEIYKICGHDHKEICKVHVERTSSKAKLKTKFTSIGIQGHGHTEREILIKANLERKRCMIYLVEKSLIPIAEMERNQGNEEYKIEIEAGADVPFVLGLCVVVIEELGSFKAPIAFAPPKS